MTVLITGAAGLIGSRFSEWVIKNIKHCKVIGIDNLSGGYIENVPKEIIFYKIDLIKDSLDKLFEKHKIDYVFHFAAYAAEGLSPFIRSFNYENNLVSTTKIINQCIKHDIKRLVFTSSLAVYGHGTGGVFDENQRPKPIDPYGVAKYACEMDIMIAGNQHALDWCIIRPHNVYGIKQNIWDKYRNVLGIWMYQFLNGQDMTIFGDGNQTRAFSFIDDSLKPLWNAAVNKLASKEIINLGGTKEISINDASKILIKVIGDGKIIYLEPRHEVKHSVATYQKSIDILDFKHRTDLEEGLSKMWEWAKNQPKRERFIWKQYELEKGIYTYWKPKINK